MTSAKEKTTKEFKCTNTDHADRKAVVYCSICKAHFCEECGKLHSSIVPHHAKHITRDFSHASPVPQKPEECPLHTNHILDLFCPTHYELCCSKCNLGKDGAHKGCPVVPFDEEDNLRAVHSNLEADITALRDKIKGSTVAALSKKQDEIGENIAAVKAEIEALFKKIRDVLNAREKELLKEVEEISEGLNLTSVASKISEMEEEAKKVVSAGQEALEWAKKKEGEGVESENEMTWEMVRRGCTVREVFERTKALEKEARKALRSVPKIVFEHSKEGAEKAAVFGKVRTVLWCPQNVVATSKGWDKVALKWDPCCFEEGKKCVYKAEVKKEEEDSSKYTEAYEGEEEGCTVSGLQSDTVYAFRVCGWLKGDESDCGREWSDAVMARTQKGPEKLPGNLKWKECPGHVDEQRKYSVDEMNPRIATKTDGNGLCCTITGKTPLPQNKVASWDIKILKSKDNDVFGIYIGVTPSDINQNQNNYNGCGWYFNCYSLTLCSGPPQNYKNKDYGPRKECGQYIHTGDSVGVVMDTAKGELSFVVSGVNLGVAYKGIPLDKPLVPCVLLARIGDSVELII